MPGEFFFMALGGLGVSLAGFVGIITALDSREDARSAVSSWRVRNIVRSGFTLTLIGFGIVAVYAASGEDLDLTVRLAALFAILANGTRLRMEFRRGPAWPDADRWRVAVAMESLLLAAFAVAVVFPSVGFLQILLIFQLGFPLSIFYFTIREIAGASAPS